MTEKMRNIPGDKIDAGARRYLLVNGEDPCHAHHDHYGDHDGLGDLQGQGEEFPAQVNVLFDSTIQKHFSPDGIWCVAAEVSQRLLEAGKR